MKGKNVYKSHYGTWMQEISCKNEKRIEWKKGETGEGKMPTGNKPTEWGGSVTFRKRCVIPQVVSATKRGFVSPSILASSLPSPWPSPSSALLCKTSFIFPPSPPPPPPPSSLVSSTWILSTNICDSGCGTPSPSYSWFLNIEQSEEVWKKAEHTHTHTHTHTHIYIYICLIYMYACTHHIHMYYVYIHIYLSVYIERTYRQFTLFV